MTKTEITKTKIKMKRIEVEITYSEVKKREIWVIFGGFEQRMVATGTRVSRGVGGSQRLAKNWPENHQNSGCSWGKENRGLKREMRKMWYVCLLG